LQPDGHEGAATVARRRDEGIVIDSPLDAANRRIAPRRADARFLWGDPMRVPERLLALGFGSGLAPWAPGTAGTLWAWVVFAWVAPWLDDVSLGVILVVSAALGIAVCARCARDLGVADPSSIVWDEVVAFWFVLWLVTPTSATAWVAWPWQLAAFALFRYFDAAKPGPVGWADEAFAARAGEAIGWRQGLGIMLDDAVAALCTLLVLAFAKPWFA
jgi:phosphatidylglycerophosphatase A